MTRKEYKTASSWYRGLMGGRLTTGHWTPKTAHVRIAAACAQPRQARLDRKAARMLHNMGISAQCQS